MDTANAGNVGQCYDGWLDALRSTPHLNELVETNAGRGYLRCTGVWFVRGDGGFHRASLGEVTHWRRLGEGDSEINS